MVDPIKLQFLGAYAGVTGSKTLVEFHNQKVLIDCGLFQGPAEVRQLNWSNLPVEAASIHAVVLTHAHLDHVGYLPRLYNQGYRGPIYCSEGTYELAQIILMDSAHLEEELADYAEQSHYSHHEHPKPLFTVHDAESVIKLFQPKPRDQWLNIGQGISLRYRRAGHIIGASITQLMFTEDQSSKTFTFTGDIGHTRSMILKAPEAVLDTDVLVIESTYGNRLHSRDDCCQEFGQHLKRALDRGGVVVIPAFAVGRSQEVIYMIGYLERAGVIPKVPVILDSPMGEKALDVFFSREEDQIIGSSFLHDPNSFFPKKFEISQTTDQSMLATMMDGPAIIVSASGMLSGGRVLHHLKKRLSDARNMLIFTGYQAEGTKGRFLQDNSASLKTLRIHHVEVELAAEVVTLDNLSSHADYEDMLLWLRKFQSKPSQVLVNHGNPEAQKEWAQRIEKELGWQATPAAQEQVWKF